VVVLVVWIELEVHSSKCVSLDYTWRMAYGWHPGHGGLVKWAQLPRAFCVALVALKIALVECLVRGSVEVAESWHGGQGMSVAVGTYNKPHTPEPHDLFFPLSRLQL
jgi:hypothetical protein